MIDRRTALTAITALVAGTVLPLRARAAVAGEKFVLSDAQWKARLSPEAYVVLRHDGTEPPFTSPLNDEHHAGTFACAGCDLPNFSSKTKFDSGTGWPSFYAPIKHAVVEKKDDTLGMVRTEIRCSRCDGHLGHVFDDGPKPTGLRYCMNGAALKFKAA